MTVTVLLNARAGSVEGAPDEQAQRIEEAFRRVGTEPEIRFVEPEKLEETARSAAERCEVIVAAGGDGTLQSVAKGVLGTRAAFAVLPVGTFNHFAKELQMPMELEAAVAAIAHGQRDEFRVPLVNGQLFLSFAAIGMFARAIRHREAQRRARQRSKLLGMAVALLRIVRQPPYRRMRLEIGGRVVRRFSSSLFVVCNEYQLQAAGLMEPFDLDRNQLNVCVAKASTRWQVIRLIISGLLGRLQSVMEVVPAPTLVVHTRHSYEPVVLDGELTTLQTPLRFSISPVPLTLIVPPAEMKEHASQMFISRS